MEHVSEEVREVRKSPYAINPLFLSRWSPRSMTGESMTEEELFSLLEAARWAPSSYNNQPWRVIYAQRDTPEWNLLFDLLVDINKGWCKNAAALLVFVSNSRFEHNNSPNRTHSYDTGAAWMSIALEGASRGLVVHGMSGFDFDKAHSSLNVPEGFTVEAMAAIGKRAPKEDLPAQMQEAEAPSNRKPLNEILIKGKFR